MNEERPSSFGRLEPRYTFALNPYPEARYSRCPECQRRMRQRKLPLFIHVEPRHLIALNYPCRYCPPCDLLIAHQSEVESLLANLFSQRDPPVLGNKYLIVGTVEHRAWREGLTVDKTIEEMRDHLHTFKEVRTIEMTAGGWYPEGEVPPIEKTRPPQVFDVRAYQGPKKSRPALTSRSRSPRRSGRISR